MNALKDYLYYAVNQIKTIKLNDILDIFFVTLIMYYAYNFMRKRRAEKLAVGVIFFVLVMLFSELFDMRALNFLLRNFVQVGLIALIILFQPELREALEKMGGNSIKSLSRFLSKDNEEAVGVLPEICIAVSQLARDGVGALIVIERTSNICDVMNGGTVIDSAVSSQLLRNIFFKDSPLHDGAVAIREGRIYAAGCILPVSGRDDIDSDLGTRHRAGIGMSEVSDAVVIVVSEESNLISVVVGGEMKRGFSRNTLEAYLRPFFIKEQPEEPEAESGKLKKIFGRFAKKDENNEKKDK